MSMAVDGARLLSAELVSGTILPGAIGATGLVLPVCILCVLYTVAGTVEGSGVILFCISGTVAGIVAGGGVLLSASFLTLPRILDGDIALRTDWTDDLPTGGAALLPAAS